MYSVSQVRFPSVLHGPRDHTRASDLPATQVPAGRHLVHAAAPADHRFRQTTAGTNNFGIFNRWLFETYLNVYMNKKGCIYLPKYLLQCSLETLIIHSNVFEQWLKIAHLFMILVQLFHLFNFISASSSAVLSEASEEAHELVDFYKTLFFLDGQSLKLTKLSWCCSPHIHSGKPTPSKQSHPAFLS